jgi:hypothetical protein
MLVNSNTSDNWYFDQKLKIDGQGRNFVATQGISLLGVDTKSYELANTHLFFKDTTTGNACFYGFGLHLSNCEIRNESTLTMNLTAGSDKDVWFENSVMDLDGALLGNTSGNVIIDKCNVTYRDLTATSANKLVTNSGADRKISITNSTFHRAYNASTGVAIAKLLAPNVTCLNNVFENWTVDVTASEGAFVDGNVIDRGSLLLNDPDHYTVTSNRIITNDYTDASILFVGTSAHIVNGLSCVGNSFVDGVSNPSTRAQYTGIGASGSFATSLHLCEIKDNSFNDEYLRVGTTELQMDLGFMTMAQGRFTIDFDVSAGTATQAEYFIFPYETNSCFMDAYVRDQNSAGNNGMPVIKLGSFTLPSIQLEVGNLDDTIQCHMYVNLRFSQLPKQTISSNTVVTQL